MAPAFALNACQEDWKQNRGEPRLPPDSGRAAVDRIRPVRDPPVARLLLALMARVLTGLALGGALSVPASLAQGTDAGAGAAADRTLHAFEVAPGALDQALGRFGRQARVLISVNAEITNGLDSPGVSGSHAVPEGFALLLAGTGLEAVADSDGSYSLRQLPQQLPVKRVSGAVALSGVVVTGRADRPGPPPDGPDGFTATRSSAGSKTDTPLLETPQSISVITQQQMEAQGVQSVSEALRYAPGVLAEQYGGTDTRSDNYVVRGFADSFPFLDGLSTLTYFSLMSPVVEPYGLERVEVLRGPSSVLSGQTGSPGGLISLVTKRPTDFTLHQVSLESGSYGRVQGTFDLGGPLDADGEFLYRLTGLARETGTQTDFVRDRRYYLAPALTWKPSGDTTLTLLAHFSFRNAGNPPDDLPTAGTLQSNPNGPIPTHFFDRDPDFDKFRRIESAFGYSFEHRFGDTFTVRQNTRFEHAALDQKELVGIGLESDLRTLDRFAAADRAAVNTFGLDTQAEARFDTGALRHTLLFGLDYLHSVDGYAEQDSAAPSIDLYHPVYGVPVSIGPIDYSVAHSIDQIGLYAEDQVRYGHWIGSVSGRHDWADTLTIDRLEDDASRIHGNAFSWRAGLIYRFDMGLAPYASAATSFTPSIGLAFDGTPLSPTTGSIYEAGLKYGDARSLLTLSAYTLHERNVPSPDLQHQNFEVQTGEIGVRGIELSDIADLGDGLRLTSAYTYMNGKLIVDSDGTNGNQAPNVPHWMISSWADKTIRRGPLRGFGFSGGLRYVGSQYGDNDNTLLLPGTLLVDGAIHYAVDHWLFSADAKNLLDKTYVGSCPALDECNYGLRRAITVRATYGW